MNKLKIVCDKCGRNINQPKPKEKKIGALVYLYFKCRRCDAVYVSSVTDPELRKNIREYGEAAATIAGRQLELTRIRKHKPNEKELIREKEKALETLIRDAEKLHRENIKRSNELKARHPLPEGARL